MDASDRLEELMAQADVNGPQRLTFRSDPERSVRLLEYALARPKIRNPAAFALTRFRAEQDAPGAEAERAALAPLEVEELEGALRFAERMRAPAVAIAAVRAELAAARAKRELRALTE